MEFEMPRPDVLAMLLLMVVIIVGPLFAGRLRIPGIIGLIIGGWVIGGPHGLELLTSDGVTIIKALGKLGLLYLMFNAGLELDLGVLRATRRAAISFGVLSFALPQIIGTAVSIMLGYDLPAAVLIGSLWASHTLVTYPAVRGAGLAGNRLVATTVGATAITDTLALLVLAVVVSVHHGGSAAAIGSTLLVGIATLLVWSFGILARVSRTFFAGAGQHRTLRFAWLLGGMLASAAVSELFGIEGIIGAFAAGIALNRLVPNESPLMERVEFFGASLLIPSFLVSVGLVINPVVLVKPSTIALAGIFVGVVIVGKGLAATLVGRSLGGTRAEIGTMFGLSLSQAAATLAAAFVGFDAGILGEPEVNAVLGVVVVSLITATLVTERAVQGVPATVEAQGIGRRVMIARVGASEMPHALALAQGIATEDTGIVHTIVPVTAMEASTMEAARREVAQAHDALMATGGEGEVSLRVGESVDDAVVSACAEHDATLLMVPWRDPGVVASAVFGRRDRKLLAAGVPSLIVRLADAAPARVVLLATYRHALRSADRAELALADDTATRLSASMNIPVVVLHVPASGIASGIASGDVSLRSAAAATVEEAPAGGAAWLAEHAQPGDVVVVGARLADSVPAAAARTVVERQHVTIIAASPAQSSAGSGMLTW